MPLYFSVEREPDDQPALSLPYIQDFENGRTNHGFRDLRGRPDLASTIAEAGRSAALKELLVALAQPLARFFTIGCLFVRLPRTSPEDVDDQAAGYVELAYSDLEGAAADLDRQLAFSDAFQSRLQTCIGPDTWKVVVAIGAIATERIGGPGIVWSLRVDFWVKADSIEDACRSADRLLRVLQAMCTA
jgi:hypothetical protein